MQNYFETIPKKLNEYFHILSNDIPDFIYEYIEAPEMKRLSKISIVCGTDHTKIFDNKMFYSRLEHSIGVALIIWNFTKDKKQALAGLFHDIANPAFSHCIDFFHGDYENQESTEERTTEIIENSEYIMNLLRRDNISLEEIKDYKIYPIADNDTPRLSSDRLEYTMSNGLAVKDIFKIEELREIYKDLVILKNEDGIDEIGFRNPQIAEYFVDKIKELWEFWISDKDRFVMQCIADILKMMVDKKIITEEDFYNFGEREILDIGLNSNDIKVKNAIKNFQEATKVYTSEEVPKDVYYINLKSKRRYINPLTMVNGVTIRIADVSYKVRKNIEDFFDYDMTKYIYSDFKF